MGNHSKSPESHRKPPRHAHRRDMGGFAVRGNGVNDGLLAAEENELAAWRGLKDEVRSAQDRVAALKRTFEGGLTALVDKRVFHPQILNCLPDVHMIRLMDEVDAANYGKNVHGYMQPGRQTGVLRETQGRYLAVENLDDTSTNIHELVHVGVRLGRKDQHHVLVEPITNKFAKGILHSQGLNPAELNIYYGPHEYLLKQVMEAADLNYYDISYFVSGDDPVKNDMMLRRAVHDKTGWDMVGCIQQAYVNNISSQNSRTPDLYAAAAAAQQSLDEQLAMRQPQYA